VIVDDVLSTDWLSPQAGAIALPQAHGYETRLVDGRSCPLSPLELDAPPPTLLQIFSRGNPFRGRAGLSEFAAQCFTRLNAQNSLVGLVVYGSPYVLAALLSELAPTVPHGFTYSQTPEGQAVLLTQLFATPGPCGRQSRLYRLIPNPSWLPPIAQGECHSPLRFVFRGNRGFVIRIWYEAGINRKLAIAAADTVLSNISPHPSSLPTFCAR
jgi:hypothetical protein